LARPLRLGPIQAWAARFSLIALVVFCAACAMPLRASAPSGSPETSWPAALEPDLGSTPDAPAPDADAVEAAGAAYPPDLMEAPGTDSRYVPQVGEALLPRRFAVLGDSLSAWVVEPGSYRASTRGSWPDRLEALDPELTLVRNAGVPGDLTYQMLPRIGNTLGSRPDVLFILGGTNDVAHHVRDSVVIENIRQMVIEAKRRGATVVLLTIPPNNQANAADRRHYRTINEGIRALGDEQRVQVVDLYTALATPSGDLPRAFVAADGLHLSPAGAQAIAEVVFRALHPA
jgi:lysophospholipase L1-like esterase